MKGGGPLPVHLVPLRTLYNLSLRRLSMRGKRAFNAFFIGFLAFCMVFSFAIGNTVSAADKVIKWKIQTHWPASSSSFKDSAQFLSDTLKERTNGRLELEIFPSGALVPAKEVFTAVKRGMVQGGTGSPGYVRDQVQIAGVAAGLPFAFKNVWEAAYFHKWYGFENMLKEAAAKHGVFWSTDKVYPTELVISKPVNSLADFKGLKLRSSGVLQKFLTKIGAAASYLPGAEVYPALASGVIDGAHWGAAQGAYSMKLYDVCKYHLLPGLNIAGTDVWFINQKAIDKLPADIQMIFYNTIEEQFWKRTNEYLYKEGTVLAKAVKEQKVQIVTLPEAEQKKITEVAMEMWDEEAARGPEAAKAVQMVKDFLTKLGHL